jgi:hypothetical protein
VIPDQALAENAALKQTVAQQQMVLHQRAEPMLTAVMDALDNLCQMAEQGHPAARQLLTRWLQVQRRTQDATRGLAVVRNGTVPQ